MQLLSLPSSLSFLSFFCFLGFPEVKLYLLSCSLMPHGHLFSAAGHSSLLLYLVSPQFLHSLGESLGFDSWHCNSSLVRVQCPAHLQTLATAMLTAVSRIRFSTAMRSCYCLDKEMKMLQFFRQGALLHAGELTAGVVTGEDRHGGLVLRVLVLVLLHLCKN